MQTHDDIYPDREEKPQIPFYREFLYKHNFGVLTAVRISTPIGFWGLMLHFNNDHPQLPDKHLALIKKIRPMFERTAVLANEIAHKRIAEFAQFFRDTQSSIYVLDVDGKQCLAIDDRGRLSTKSAPPSIVLDDISGDLKKQLKEDCESDPNLSLSQSYQFNQDSKSTNVLAIQIPRSLRHYFKYFKTCAIVTECTEMDALKQKRLKGEYMLSKIEVSTVGLISSGKTPNAIADILSLKASSVRQRLKTIFEKANVNSQVELVALYGKL